MEIQGPGPNGPNRAALPPTFTLPPNLAAAGTPAGARAAGADSGQPAKPLAASQSSFWELLTPEEREFFEKQAALGPITYKPGGKSSDVIAVPTGRRIDVRG